MIRRKNGDKKKKKPKRGDKRKNGVIGHVLELDLDHANIGDDWEDRGVDHETAVEEVEVEIDVAEVETAGAVTEVGIEVADQGVEKDGKACVVDQVIIRN